VDHQSQVHHLYQTLVFHILRVLHTTQVPHQWTQMLQCGKELPSTMEKFMVKSSTRKMLTTSKHTVKLKRLQLTQEFLMHPLLFNSKLQLNMLVMTKNFHTLMEVVLITQVLRQWIQTNQYGKEQQFMTVRPMVRKNIKKMQMIFKLMVKPKRQLQTQEFHMPQPLFRLNLSMLVRHTLPSDKFHWTTNS